MKPDSVKHIYSFSDYSQDIKLLANMINEESRETHIVTPYRGGLPLGVALSNKTDSPLSILEYQRYDGNTKEVKLMHNANISSNELLILIDDLVDEGITMAKSVEFLRREFPNNPVKVFTIFGKHDIDFPVKSTYLREHPGRWIHFEPWE